ncbi:MAG TPA: V-type ATP synthase subunit E family protein [Deltaproteobacteria bacterium]|nr:V-type ATP synthase subunit E family protein [Deltaproteobacteria bacterium]HPJ93546.1 V-type ATP synthase subunit E family protein [Deltaproteobacteria bacterium]HPR51083.1 V-type ATP synthase subunit E family protein [Deltaproteobacteria bacterium]
MEAEKIRQAILNKAEQEAAGIVEDARAKAADLIEKAEKARDLKFEQIKDRILAEAKQESDKILAKGAVDARLTVLKQKDLLLKKVISQVKEELAKNPTMPQTWTGLIHEVVSGLDDSHKIRFRVASKDIDAIKKIVADNDELGKQIKEISEVDCLGGLLAEDTQGKVSIDNTYDTRLEMLLTKILPEIGQKLFSDGAK